MSFSESGGVITQTGTDTSLSGLNGVSGVTTFSQGGRSIYRLGNRQLVVSGTLTHDPETEMLFFEDYGAEIAMRITGTYTLGSYDSTTGRYSSGTALRFGRNSDSNYLEAQSDVYIDTTGTMEWYGGVIHSDRQFTNYGTWNTYSKEAKLIAYTNIRKNIRQRGTCNIDGFVSSDFIFGVIVNPNKLANWSPYSQVEKGFNISTSAPDNVYAVAENFDPSGLAGEHTNFWQDKWGRFINCFTGSDLNIVGLQPDHPENKGLFEVRQKVRLKYLDTNLSSLDGIKVSMTDTNNSNRLGANQINSNSSYTSDRSYTGTSSSGEILFDTDGGVLVAVHWRTTGGVSGTALAGNNKVDYRGLTNNSNDNFTFYSCGYEYQINATTKALKGANGEDLEVVMIPDFSITESTKATVDAYTTLDNAAELYDRAKAYLYDNFAGEAATYVSRDGTAINAGSYDLVIDATAASAFAVSGNTITIKSSRYSGDITTTGTITLSNGAVVIGTLTDTTGTTTTTTLAFTGLKANTEIRVYAAGTSTEVAGVENSGTSESFDISENSVDIVIHALGYINQVLESVTTTSNVSLPISQVLDRQYNNP